MKNVNKLYVGINLPEKATTTADEKGDIEVVEGKLRYHDGSTVSPVVTETHAAEIENKTIDADKNTISELEVDNLKEGVLVTSTELTEASDTNVPSTLAAKTYIDAADTILQTNIDTEESERITADEILQQNIDNESSNRNDADNLLQINIDNEEAARIAADTTLQANIDSLESVTSADLADETAARIDGDETLQTNIDDHINNVSGAHEASAISVNEIVGVTGVNVQQVAVDLKDQIDTKEPVISAGDSTQYYRGDKTFQTLDKAAVGLNNVDNTSDANKPISTATQTALDTKITGPESSTDNAIARFDGTTGKLAQNSLVTISDVGALAAPTVTATNITANTTLNVGTSGQLNIEGGVLETSATINTSGTDVNLGTLNKPVLRLINAGLVSIGGIQPPFNDRYTIINNTGNDVTILNNARANNTKILTGTGADLVLKNDASIIIYGSITGDCWNIIGGSGSGGGGASTDAELNMTATGLEGKTLKEALEDGSLAPSILDQKITVPKIVQNTFTAVLSTDSVSTISIASQNGGFISSVNIPSDRRYNVNFTAGYFTDIPSVQVTAQDSSGATRVVHIASLTTTAMQIFSSPDDTGITRLFITAEKQGADYKNPLTETQEITIPLTQAGIIQEPDLVLNAAGNAGQTVTANVTDIPFNIVSDNTGAWNGSTFTVPSDGVYHLSGVVTTASATNSAVDFYVDGVFSRRANFNGVSNTAQGFDIQGRFTQGQVLSFRLTATIALSNSTSGHYLNITSVRGIKQVNVNPNQKATIPTSEVRFEGASSRGSVATAIVKFDNVAKLSGDAFEIVNTAADGTYVRMLKKGTLSVGVSLFYTVTANVLITKNQQSLTTNPASSSEMLTSEFTVANETASHSWSGSVNIGDIIRVSSQSNSPAANIVNNLNLHFQENEVAVSVSNTLPQFSESDLVVRCAGNGGQVLANGNDIPFSVISDSVGGSWNGTQFNVPESGLYTFSVSLLFTTAASRSINFVSTSLTKRISDRLNSDRHHGGITEFLNAGDIVSLKIADGDGTLSNNTQLHYLNITKVGKPNVTGVDVTPFVRIPQPESGDVFMRGSALGTTNTRNVFFGTPERSNPNGLFSITGDSAQGTIFTALKAINLSVGTNSLASTGDGQGIAILKNNTQFTTDAHLVTTQDRLAYTQYNTIAGFMSTSADFRLSAGETFRIATRGGNQGDFRITVTATALSDQILTPPETFSTDTAALTYAPSSQYTLTTLANAPVGTYITFTIAAGSNTRTQTTARPAQTDADMNANGIRIYTRPFAAFNNNTIPPVFAIQIGKGMKGVSKDLYKTSGKVTAGELDYFFAGNDATSVGLRFKSYDEKTGILLIDSGTTGSTVSTALFLYNDGTTSDNGYLVINASKNPALTGMNVNRVAVKAFNSAATVYGTAANPFIFNTKPLDTHNALNVSTGVFTTPVSGIYQVNAAVLFQGAAYAADQGVFFVSEINNVVHDYGLINKAGGASTLNHGGSYSSTIYLSKGQSLRLLLLNERGNTALNPGTAFNHMSITRISD